MADFTGYASGLTSPATRALSVTPNDNDDLDFPARALYVGGGGDVSLIAVGGDTTTFAGLPAGFILPVRTSRVRATGTTATGIIALA